MKKLLFAVPFTVLLTACEPASVEDLMKDPDLMEKVAKECEMKLKKGKSIDTEECNNAQIALMKMLFNGAEEALR